MCLPCSKSRTTSSDHLSPRMSSELAIAQAERAKGFAVFMGPALQALQASDLQSASHYATVAYTLAKCKSLKESVMTTIVLPQPAESQPSGRGGIRLAVAIALTVWLLLVVSLGAAGAFVGPPGTPPCPLRLELQRPW